MSIVATCIACSILLLFYSTPTNSLIVQTPTQQFDLTSHYTTLGPHQLQQYKYNFTLLHANDITDTCTFTDITKATFAKDTLLVIQGSLPNTPACTSDIYGTHAAVARLAQESGFAGVVLQSEEKFYDGRIVGFDSSITIPYLVVSSTSIRLIVSNASMIDEIVLPEISSKDAHKLKAICKIYFAWRILGGILYGSQIFMIGYFLWIEMRKKKKLLWQSVSLKALAFVAALFSFLWVSVDPFGFLGVIFPSAMFIGVVSACFFCMFMFLLQIWTLSVGGFGVLNSQLVSILIYVVSAAMIVLSLFQGILWFINALRLAAMFVMSLILAICGFGFIFTGKRMISILRNSNNMAADQNKLAKKIVSFVIFYLSLNSTTVVIYLAGLLGKIVSLMVVHIACGVIILSTFAILFLPAVLKQQPWLNIESDPIAESPPEFVETPPITVTMND